VRRRSLAALAILAVLGCDREPPRALPAGPSPSQVASARQAIVTKLVASALSEVRARKLELVPPEWEDRRVAFGRRLLVRLGSSRLEAFAVPSMTPLFSEALEGPRGLVELPGGSVLAIDVDAALRIDPDAKTPVRLPRISATPGVVFLPERRNSAQVWAVHRSGGIAARHELALDRKLSLLDTITLEGYDGGPIAAMKNGELLFRSADGVRITVPEGRPRSARADIRPWRLLPARRVDQAFAVSAEGEVRLWQLGEGLLVRRRLELGSRPISAASSGDVLAVVTVKEAPAGRAFELRVIGPEGETLLSLPLGAPAEPLGEDWAAKLVAEHDVSISESDGLVAVGGPSRLRVFSLRDGKSVFDR
jgi:hypothetical protein